MHFLVLLSCNKLHEVFHWAYMFELHCWSDVLTHVSAFSTQIPSGSRLMIMDEHYMSHKKDMPKNSRTVFFVLNLRYTILKFKDFSRTCAEIQVLFKNSEEFIKNSGTFHDILLNSRPYKPRLQYWYFYTKQLRLFSCWRPYRYQTLK